VSSLTLALGLIARKEAIFCALALPNPKIVPKVRATFLRSLKLNFPIFKTIFFSNQNSLQNIIPRLQQIKIIYKKLTS
jgi:hypothetical protein